MKKTLLWLIFLSLTIALPAVAAERPFGYFAGHPSSLRPPMMPPNAKEGRSSVYNNPKYGDTVEWLAYRQQDNTTNQAHSLVEIEVFRGTDSTNPKYHGAKDQRELSLLEAEWKALRRLMAELSIFEAVARQSGKTSTMTYNTLPDKRYIQGTIADYIKARKTGKIGNYHTLGWVERVQSEHGMVYTRDLAQAGNVFIRTRTLVSKGYDGGLPSSKTTMNYLLAKLSGEAFVPSPEPAPVVVTPGVKEPEATHRPEFDAYPSMTGIIGTTALIPATDQLPARLVLKGGKPSSSVVFRLRRDGGLLKFQGKQDPYELSVRVDAQGNAELLFLYTGGPIRAVVEYEVIAMNEGKKATARVLVGLGLDFERIRAIKGQSNVSNIYAFSLGVKSRFHPKLDVANYLYNAGQSKAWGDRNIGIRITPEWLNRDAGGDVAYDWTTEIKPLAIGNGLVATDSAKGADQPYYDAMKYSYPAVKLESSGKHIYKVEGTPVVMKVDGVVVKKETAEPPMTNQPLLVMTVDGQPDSYFKMLSCSLDAQDGIQWLIWEGAKMIPGAGKVFDGVQTGAGILCKLTGGDYENAFYDFFNFTGGKALDKLGAKLKENPGKYSQKVHVSYKKAQIAYDKLMEKKNREERDRLVRKSLEKYGLAPSSPQSEDDIDPGQAPPLTQGAAVGGSPDKTSDAGGAKPEPGAGSDLKDIGKDFKKSIDDVKKAAEDAGKDFRDIGTSLKNIFK